MAVIPEADLFTAHKGFNDSAGDIFPPKTNHETHAPAGRFSRLCPAAGVLDRL
jgi:hypothetical protein